MSDQPKFNEPVFVRIDDTTTIKASVVEWNATDPGAMSVLIGNGNESVLICVRDWAALVGCVNREIERLS